MKNIIIIIMGYNIDNIRIKLIYIVVKYNTSRSFISLEKIIIYYRNLKQQTFWCTIL